MQTLKRAILLVSTCLLLLGCEREGIVDITDCPEKLYLDHGTKQGSRPLEYLFTTFTCQYDRTRGGRSIIGGFCIARENALFHAGCVRAAMYTRKSDIHCPAHQHAKDDGKCYCDSGYENDPRFGGCSASATN